MWEHLFQEIIDSVANRSLLHLSRLLSLLIATAQIDNVSQISGEQKASFDILIPLFSIKLIIMMPHMCTSCIANIDCLMPNRLQTTT